ncbi:MAG: YggS family pyridoxal phosphate-dependent enzyme [Bacteroidales bacterium]|nr:YggS family pyridoxal phosphate-dependent enzyme [Bacteroidales bacterium]
MNISENLKHFLRQVPENLCLVAVSKTQSNENIMQAYNAGHKILGENKVQELEKKYTELPKDIQWHFIGHLQTNKVRKIIPFVHLIHGVDRFRLLKEINRQAKINDKVQDVLLQFFIATEDTKFGFSIEEATEMLESKEFEELENIRIVGVMGMATYTNDENQIRNEFKALKSYFDKLKSVYFEDKPYFKEISMGMSNDFKIAIEEGSTIIRIGSSIFGERDYSK